MGNNSSSNSDAELQLPQYEYRRLCCDDREKAWGDLSKLRKPFAYSFLKRTSTLQRFKGKQHFRKIFGKLDQMRNSGDLFDISLPYLT